MRKTSLFLGALALTLTAAAGCDGTSTGEPGPAEECHDADTAGCVIQSDAQRIQSPNVPDEDLQALVTGNTTFAVDLYQQLKVDPGNLFYSPHSISMALAMTWAGARGQTEADMASVLGFTLTQDKTHAAFNALDLALASRGEGAQGSDGQGFRLAVANAMWAQIGFPFEAKYLDTIALNYGAGVHIADFEAKTTDAIDLINEWVGKKTEGKIDKLVNEEVVTKDTRFVLTNAIYFNAAWAQPFDESNTKDGKFNLLDGTSVTVPMLAGSQHTTYADGEGYEAVKLKYDGGELSMVVVVPDAGTFADFEASLDAAAVSDILDSIGGSYDVAVTMPKFGFDAEFNLSKSLKALGMTSAFEGADFSGMSSEGLVVTDVVHKSFVSVSEAGTEAAAATAVIGGPTSAPEPAAITIDRPFLFFIQDNPTGAILFVGRVQDPSK
jgi:serpin B